MTPAPASRPPQNSSQAPAARPWQQSALLALLAVALVLGVAWAVARSQSPYPFYGSVVNSSEPAYIFSGTDGNGRPWTLQPQGKQTLLFFGFTYCPDICPLTLKYLDALRDRMTPEERQQVQVVFVSVDPDRDTPQRIREYVEYFGEGTGVRVPEPELSRVAQAYGVAYGKVPVDGPLKYQINHTTATYLIDASGYTRVMWDYTQLPDVDRILRDVRYVMNHPREPQAGAAVPLPSGQALAAARLPLTQVVTP
ncbi:SCO family protein [Deinococcus sp. Marseille-Q6407]|uniref:SCO family protein n=1 Tax=Deinococcus sp. Marseille-Q6407 TaxID=2969223 RepID=UPI0021C12445|nr:SCO family protein [Deinococcus sp. Marseille-Q6407]